MVYNGSEVNNNEKILNFLTFINISGFYLVFRQNRSADG